MLNGLFPALATPFTDGRIDVARFRENLDRYARVDLSGYLVLGSTAEAVYLEADERERLIDAARRAIPEERLMIVGVPAEATLLAARAARDASDRGADAVLVSMPHYFKAQMDDDALIDHYRSVADASPIPVWLYNVPKFTGLALPVAAVAALSRHDNIVGIKESSGEIAYVREILRQVPEPFHLLAGHARTLVQAIEAGAAGAILASAVALPEPLVRIERLARSGNSTEATEILGRLSSIGGLVDGSYGVPGLKAAMDVRGLHGGLPRAPLRAIAPSAATRLRSELERSVDEGLLETLRL